MDTGTPPMYGTSVWDSHTLSVRSRSVMCTWRGVLYRQLGASRGVQHGDVQQGYTYGRVPRVATGTPPFTLFSQDGRVCTEGHG